MGSKLVFHSDGPRSLPERTGNSFAFQLLYCELSVTNQQGSYRKPHFIIFLVWSALIVVGWCWRVAESLVQGRLKYFTMVCRDIMTLFMTTVSLDPQTTQSSATHSISIVFIASAKIPEREGSISPSSFFGQLLNYQSHDFSFIYQVDEFSFKEMKMWGQSKISSYCFVFDVNQENQEAGGVQDSLCVTPVVKTLSSDRDKIIIIIIIIIMMMMIIIIITKLFFGLRAGDSKKNRVGRSVGRSTK